MNTVKELIKLIDKKQTKPIISKTFWRGADLIICSPATSKKDIGNDEPVFHEQAIEIGNKLKRVLRVIWNDEKIDYNFQNKYHIIKDLVSNLQQNDPSKELIRRAINLVLKSHGTKLYFAYGSNMSLEQMKERCPHAVLVSTARIQGYEFIINERGVATIIESSTGWVEGLVFEVTEKCEESLDRYEGVSWGTYKRASVVSLTGVEMMVYLARDKIKSLPFRQEYFQLILSSAKSVGLSEEYIEKLEAYLNQK